MDTKVSVIHGVKLYLANYLWGNWMSQGDCAPIALYSDCAPTLCALLSRRERDLYIELCLWLTQTFRVELLLAYSWLLPPLLSRKE